MKLFRAEKKVLYTHSYKIQTQFKYFKQKAEPNPLCIQKYVN